MLWEEEKYFVNIEPLLHIQPIQLVSQVVIILHFLTKTVTTVWLKNTYIRDYGSSSVPHGWVNSNALILTRWEVNPIYTTELTLGEKRHHEEIVFGWKGGNSL